MLWGRTTPCWGYSKVTQAKVMGFDQKINKCRIGNTTACIKVDTTQIPQKSKEILLMIFRDIGMGHVLSSANCQ